MSEFIGVVFPDEGKADEAWRVLRELEAQGRIVLSGMAVVAKGDTGQVSVGQTLHEGARGATAGALIGALGGLAGGIAGAALGAAAGALVGRAADVSNRDDRSKFVGKVSREIKPGGAAVLADLTEHAGAALAQRMAALGGTIIRE